MTGPSNPAGESVEGNVTEIDMENRYLLLEDRAGKPFIKIFWKKAQEIFDDKPTKIFTQLQKIKAGWYVAPIVENEESSVGGGLKEANLKELPYKERPADFPRPQKKGFGGGSGGWKGQPKNDRAIIHEVTYQELHATFRQWLILQSEPVTFDQIMTYTDTVCDRSKAHAKALIEAAGVQ